MEQMLEFVEMIKLFLKEELINQINWQVFYLILLKVYL
jgi:hypothetical protein